MGIGKAVIALQNSFIVKAVDKLLRNQLVKFSLSLLNVQVYLGVLLCDRKIKRPIEYTTSCALTAMSPIYQLGEYLRLRLEIPR